MSNDKISSVDNNSNDDNSNSINSVNDFSVYSDTTELYNQQLLLVKSVKDSDTKLNKTKQNIYDPKVKKNISERNKSYDSAAKNISTLQSELQSLTAKMDNNSTTEKLNLVADSALKDKTNLVNVNNTLTDSNEAADVNMLNVDINNINDANPAANNGVDSNASTSGTNVNQFPWKTIPVKNKRVRKVKINVDDVNDNRYTLLTIDDDDDNNYSDEEIALPCLKREKKVSMNQSNKGILNSNQNKERIIKKGVGSVADKGINLNKNILGSTVKSTGSGSAINPAVEKNVEKKMRIPPIICYDLKMRELRDFLINCKTVNYKISAGANSNRCIIYATDAETQKNILFLLNNSNVNHYTFTPKNEQGVKLILKNVPIDYSSEEVLSEFRKLNKFDFIDRVVLLERGSTAKFHYFLIKLKTGVLASAFNDVKVLFNCRIIIEKFNQTDLVQCFKCQRPGHVSSNCYMEARCVKCGLTHDKNICSISKESPRALLSCVLCKEKGHTSSYRGCPVLQKILITKIKNKNTNNRTRSNFVEQSINNLVDPRVSYAGAVRKNTGNNPSRNFDMNFPPIKVNKPTTSSAKFNQVPQTSSGFSIGNIQNILNDASEDCFGCDFNTLKGSFEKFMLSYNLSEDLNTRRNALFNFILETNYA